MTEAALAEAYAHCEALVRDADRARWLATLFAPADRRPAIHALHAFRLEIEAVRDKVREPLAGELRLQWWTDAIEGEARGDVRGHPVAAALLDTIKTARLSRGRLTAWIEAKRQDLYDEPVADELAFDAWAEATTGVMLGLEADILAERGALPTEVQQRAARVLATIVAVRLLGHTQAPRTEVRVPLDLLQAQGIGTAEVAVRRVSPAIRSVLAKLAARAEAEFAALRRLRGSVPDVVAPALLTVNFVPPLLREFVGARFDPFERPVDLPLWRKQWILWRASRRNGLL